MSNTPRIRSKGPQRIITPDKMHVDAQAAAAYQQAQKSPLWPMVEKLLKDVAQLAMDLKTVYSKHQSLAVQYNALIDFLGYKIMLGDEGSPDLFAPASDAREYAHFIAEHSELGQFLPMLRHRQMNEGLPMREVMAEVREFNNGESAHGSARVSKIRGDQFGLIEWLEENPEELLDEELVAIGKEFALRRDVSGNNEEDEDGGQGEESSDSGK